MDVAAGGSATGRSVVGGNATGRSVVGGNDDGGGGGGNAAGGNAAAAGAASVDGGGVIETFRTRGLLPNLAVPVPLFEPVLFAPAA